MRERPGELHRLHIKVSRDCNNHCIFCLDNAARRVKADKGTVVQLLEKFAHLKKVLFTCGEPTLHEELGDFILLAVKKGFTDISLVTNGRRLSYPSYAWNLLEAGVTEFMVGIHGHEPRVHDPLTRVAGSFHQTFKGIENLISFRKGLSHPVSVRTISVITRRNLPHLRSLVSLLFALGVDEVILNAPQPQGRAWRHFDAVVPLYSEIGRALMDLREGEGEIITRRIGIIGLPLCLLRGSPELLLRRETIYLREGERDRRLREARDQVRGEVCTNCSGRSLCKGVFRGYVKKMGWSEFSPLAEEEGL